MKIAFIMDDEAWFWIYNEDTHMWEAWYENADLTAHRIPKNDRAQLVLVQEIIKYMRMASRMPHIGTHV